MAAVPVSYCYLAWELAFGFVSELVFLYWSWAFSLLFNERSFDQKKKQKTVAKGWNDRQKGHQNTADPLDLMSTICARVMRLGTHDIRCK